MRLHLVSASLAFALLVTPLSASAQRQRPDESWGKPGVSFLQYRTDAVECAHAVGQGAPVEYALVDLVFPSNMPGAVAGGDDISLRYTIESADPGPGRMSRPWREISRQLRPALVQCLTDRGYRRFRLTKDEMRELNARAPGSKARQIYLWNLAVSRTSASR